MNRDNDNQLRRLSARIIFRERKRNKNSIYFNEVPTIACVSSSVVIVISRAIMYDSRDS